MTITAELIRNDVPCFKGDARLYKLSEKVDGTNHIVISAVVAFGSSPETYIFPASPAGVVTDFGEMPGSLNGELDHEQALKGFLEYANAVDEKEDA